jgi:hypothetical protein
MLELDELLWEQSNEHKLEQFQGGIIWTFYTLYLTMLHLPLLGFHCVGGGWDRTQDCCVFNIDSI